MCFLILKYLSIKKKKFDSLKLNKKDILFLHILFIIDEIIQILVHNYF